MLLHLVGLRSAFSNIMDFVFMVVTTQTQLLLQVDLTLFLPPAAVKVHVSVPWLDIATEDLVNFFKSPTSGLGEAEEDVDGHGSAETTKDEISLTLDVFLLRVSFLLANGIGNASYKCRGDKVRQSKIEDPVRSSGDGNSLASNSEREQLRRIYP